MTNCPYCGKPLNIRVGRVHPGLGPGWDYSQGHEFETTGPGSWPAAGGDLAGPVEARRSAPARPATVESDFIVPALQSLATGAAVAIPTIGVTIWQGWPWYSPLVAGGVTVTVTWLQLLGAHRKLLWIIETVSSWGGDDAPGQQSKPAKAPPVSLQIKHTEFAPTSRTGHQILDLPEGITEQMFLSWGQQVADGILSPARSNWVGSERPFSRDGYDQFTRLMCDVGILRDVPGKGRQLTNGGRRALKMMVERAAAGGGG